MKSKNGKVSLSKDDIRLGNFVLSKEKQHYKLQDINSSWTTRIAYVHPMFVLIEECIKAANKEYLEAITKILYAISTTPPDGKMLEDLFAAYNALIDRMRQKGVVTQKQDEEDLERVRKTYEAVEHLNKAINDKPDSDTKGQPV